MFTRLEDLYVASDTDSTKDPGVVVELKGVGGVAGWCRVAVDLDKAAIPAWISKVPWKVKEAEVVVTTKLNNQFAVDELFAAPGHDLQRLCIELTKPRTWCHSRPLIMSLR
jgi:hypothetical protein